MNDDWNQIKWHLYKKHLLRFRLWNDKKRLDKQKPTVQQLREKIELYRIAHKEDDLTTHLPIMEFIAAAGRDDNHPMYDTVHEYIGLLFEEAYYDLESRLL